MLRFVRPLLRTTIRPRFHRPFSTVNGTRTINFKVPERNQTKQTKGVPNSLISITNHPTYYRVESVDVFLGDLENPLRHTFYIDKLLTEQTQLYKIYPRMERFFNAVCNDVEGPLTKLDIRSKIDTTMDEAFAESLLDAKFRAQHIVKACNNLLNLMTKDELQIKRINNMIMVAMMKGDDYSENIKKSLVLLHKFALHTLSILGSYEMAQQQFLEATHKIFKSHTHFIPMGDYFNSYAYIYTIASTPIPRTKTKLEADLNELSALLKKKSYDETDEFVIAEMFGEWAKYIDACQKIEE